MGNIKGIDSRDMDIIHEDHESTMYDYEKEYDSLTIKDYRELSSYTTKQVMISLLRGNGSREAPFTFLGMVNGCIVAMHLDMGANMTVLDSDVVQ